VDLLIITRETKKYTESDNWLTMLGEPPVIRRQQWGTVTERRVCLPSGLEVEFGITTKDWVSISPIDNGTLRVVSDGMKAIYDPRNLLDTLSRAVAVNSPASS